MNEVHEYCSQHMDWGNGQEGIDRLTKGKSRSKTSAQRSICEMPWWNVRHLSDDAMWSIVKLHGKHQTNVTDTAKLTGPRTLADKRWVGPVKLLCITMFDISKIRPKSVLGPVKAQKFSRCLMSDILTYFADTVKGPTKNNSIYLHVPFSVLSLRITANQRRDVSASEDHHRRNKWSYITLG